MKRKIAVLFLAVALLASQNVLASKAETGEESAGDAAVAAEAVEGEALAEDGVEETQETAPQEIQAAEESVENTLAAYAEPAATDRVAYGGYEDENGVITEWVLTADWTLIYFGDGSASGPINYPEIRQKLRKVILEEGIKGIDSGAFSGYENLTEIVIPESVDYIEADAFANCTSLKKIDIPNGVAKIGEGAFGDCQGLVEVNLPNSLTEIGDDAFYGCTSLEKINFPNGVIKIGGGAFLNCESLTRLIIPSSVSEIGGMAFTGCDRLQEVIFQGDAPAHRNSGNYMLREPFDYVTVTAYYPLGNPTWTEEARMTLGIELNWIPYGDLHILPEVTDNIYVLGGSDGATIACSGELKDFVDVYVDDVLVDKENYTVAEGSTILTFTSKYLNTLSVGTHKVTLNYTYGSIDTQLEILAYGSSSIDTGETGSNGGTEGSASVDMTVTRTSAESGARITKKSPQTGDENSALPWLLLCFAAVSGGTAVSVRKRRTVHSGKFI